MIIQNDDCLVCLDPISNPICRECHIIEVESWMEDLKIDSEKRKIIIKLIQKKLPKNEDKGNSTCIICKKNQINICSYCLFYISLKVLIDANFPEEIIEDFLETFNYQLGNTEYPIKRNIF